jgi:plastocyanin
MNGARRSPSAVEPNAIREGFVTRATRVLAAQVFAVAALAAVAACGGDSNGTPTGPGAGSGSPGPSGATITIANGAVSPSTVTISVGQSVTFVNNDGGVRNVTSDPHPVHTDCPQINAVGNISNGQTKLTSAFTAAGSCGFHDHDRPDEASRKGRINIQ